MCVSGSVFGIRIRIQEAAEYGSGPTTLIATLKTTSTTGTGTLPGTAGMSLLPMTMLSPVLSRVPFRSGRRGIPYSGFLSD